MRIGAALKIIIFKDFQVRLQTGSRNPLFVDVHTDINDIS